MPLLFSAFAMADFNNFPMISEAYLGLYSKIPKAVSTSLPLMASSTKHAFVTEHLRKKASRWSGIFIAFLSL